LQILVSHHVELLLPITDYIIRILDGKIDAQGSPAELRAAGELDGLIAVEEAEAAAEEPITSNKEQDQEAEAVEEADQKKGKKAKGPGKKLVQGMLWA
jgi:ABC-type multidrug transport system ATPase subunit